MTPLQGSLAANLKALRQRWGWSQAELAERADMSTSHLGEVETGAKWPSPEFLERLAKALQVPPARLFLDPLDLQDYTAWLEGRDQVQELGERLLNYFENRRP